MVGPLTIGGVVSGSRVTFVGDAMASVVRGVVEARELIGQPPVIVGGLAVLSRLSNPYRATCGRPRALSRSSPQPSRCQRRSAR